MTNQRNSPTKKFFKNEQELLLAVLASSKLGTVYERVQIQKILFVLDREAKEDIGGPFFDFKPYKFGPFDQNVYNCLDKLSAHNFIESPTNNSYRLNSKGYQQGRKIIDRLPTDTWNSLQKLTGWVCNCSFDELIQTIYRLYPDMKENSEYGKGTKGISNAEDELSEEDRMKKVQIEIFEGLLHRRRNLYRRLAKQ